MNKFVNIYLGSNETKVVKIDSDTEEILKKGEEIKFQLGCGLNAEFDLVNNCVVVTAPKIYVIKKGDDEAEDKLHDMGVKSKQIFELVGEALKTLNKDKIVKGVKFSKIQGATYTIEEIDGELIATSELQDQKFAYYTEDNFNYLVK